ncbi:alpha/beta hydrolase [Rhodococcus sp. WS4]|nr:alpha/beta hydrolase [Rhodococcus sp. WS4]
MTINEVTEPSRDRTATEDQRTASWAFFPGAGGGSTLWQPIAERFGGTVSALPALESVTEIADALETSILLMPVPRILVGNSLGALVALEIAQRVPVAGLMMLAAGWDFPVSDELIQRVDTGGRPVFAESARRCVSPGAPSEQCDAVIADFETREEGTMARHLRAIRDHQPRITSGPQPLTLVLRGGFDRSVSLRDHVELTERTGGALIPLGSAAHMPFVDHEEEVVRWLQRLQAAALTA